MPAYVNPAEIRDRALQLAVQGLAERSHTLTDLGTRAHYLAHYLADEGTARTQICSSATCLYRAPQVPSRIQ